MIKGSSDISKVRVHSDSVLCWARIWAQRRCNYKMGRSSGKNSKCPLLMENYWESMEKQLNSSGMSSQDRRHCRFFKNSRMICKSGTLNLKNSQIGSSSCQFSTILTGQGKGSDEICISNSEKKAKNAREVPSRRKVEFHSFTGSTAIQGNWSPSLHKCQCTELWNSENVERKRNHTLQCGCFKHRTLVPNLSFCKSAQYLRSSFELV